ncbi:NlpC/P60 family protein [Amycolatopsis balhimycina]|uniref:NlpC/P60 family protein n=1 Tax=Amycolatopsis balhimycina TaxID=208443 RepID=UPI001FE096AF|nr:NlpC/P60 family protein [Amycolatopsis balhimycina]
MDLPGTAQAQHAAGPRIPAQNVGPGDLVFFGTGPAHDHPRRVCHLRDGDDQRARLR